MANTYVKMMREGHNDIQELAKIIKKEMNAELVTETLRYIDGVKIIFYTYEKLFWRTANYAGLSILITESNLIQTIDIVGFAGGGGIFNLSGGANKKFANEAITILTNLGFRKE